MRVNKHLLDNILKVLVVIFGSILVSFADLTFLEPLHINSGGTNGLAIILQQFSQDPETRLLIYNITTTSATWVLWLVGLIAFGKEFAFKTLIATLVFPLTTVALSYVPFFKDFVDSIASAVKGDESIGNVLLAAIFGGIFVGAGVAITFVGGGSTGGFDVITLLLSKVFRIKNSVSSFITDGTIIVIGMIVYGFNSLATGLCGILSAFVCALLIEYIYVGFQTSYQVDIISSKWEEISRFAQDELGRGATIIPAKGGYKGEDRPILRVVFDRTQYRKIRNYIAQVDPKAFITFTVTNAVFGEGFKNHHSSSKKVKNGK